MSDCNGISKALVGELEDALADGFFRADTRTVLEASCCELYEAGTPVGVIGNALHSIWAATQRCSK
jgi:hypothetical protein